MSVETSPIFFFIPGAWHSPDTFNAVRAVLAQRGHESTAVALPSVGSDKPFNVGLHADIAHVHHALRALAKMGRKIVLIMHSYGGMVGSGALEGLGYAQRQQNDLSGGVIMAVWMASFVTPKGKCLFDMLGNQWLPWMMFTVCILPSCLPIASAHTPSNPFMGSELWSVIKMSSGMQKMRDFVFA